MGIGKIGKGVGGTQGLTFPDSVARMFQYLLQISKLKLFLCIFCMTLVICDFFCFLVD